MKKSFLILIAFTMSLYSYAQAVPAFNRFITGGYFSDMVELPDGDHLLIKPAGPNSIIVRTDQNGMKKWIRQYSGGGHIWQAMLNSPTSILMLGQHATTNFDPGIFIAKADTSGNVQWAKKLVVNTTAHPHKMIKTWDNHILILGADSLKEILIKMDTLGNVLWSKHYYKYNDNQNGGWWGAGSIVELPDHSLAMFCNTRHNYTSQMGTIQYSSASLLKLDPSGNVQWAKKYAPYNANFMYQGPSAWDIFHTSDGNFLMTLYGYRTMRVSASGEVIDGNCISSVTQIKVISEYPAGTVNIGVMGGAPGDVIVFYYKPEVIRANLDFTNVSAVKEESPIQSMSSITNQFTFYNVRQLADKRIAFTGECGGPAMLITDSAGGQECTSQPIVKQTFYDTSIFHYDIDIDTSSGIIATPMSVMVTPSDYAHCTCDSLPVASFTYVVSGLTVTFTNTSQNATTYSWSFGDGTYSSDPNPVHTYTSTLPNGGVYLVAGNNCGSKVFHSYLGPNIYVTNTVPACNGLCQGVATAHIMNGVPPYTYSWNTIPAQADSTATGLCEGTYEVTVTDGNGLFTIQQVEVPESDFDVDISVQQNVICHGDSTGKLLAYTSTSWGSGPVSFIWNSDPLQNTDSLVHLPGGTYAVMATDNIGCHAYDTVTLLEYDTLTISTTSTPDFNTACIATAEATVLTGTQPYSYLWSNAETTATASALCGGQSYVVTVTDMYNCIAIDTVYITDSVITTGLDKTAINDLIIMPNPVKDIFTIKWDDKGTKVHSIRVTSITGALIQEIDIKRAKGAAQVNSSNWAQGTYLVAVYDNGGHLIRQVKLIKQ